MSKFEPEATKQTCWNCRHADRSCVLTTYPAQIRCNLFGKLVYTNQTECLEDKPEEAKNDEQYVFVEGEIAKGWNAEQIKTALTTFEKKEGTMPNWRKYRKRPVVIEAYQTDKEMEIKTLEGTMKANVGDWIIKGVNGELYPCKPGIFAKTYEEAE